MDLGLRGSRALITGGSRGIGLAIADALAAEGAAVGIVARGTDGLAAAAGRLARRAGGRPLPPMSPTRPRSRRPCRRSPPTGRPGPPGGERRRHGRGESADSAPGDFAATFSLNAGHAAELIRPGLPYLGVAGGPCVIISSITGMRPAPRTTYAVAKAAEIHLAATAAAELAPRHPGERGQPWLDHVPRRRLGPVPAAEPAGLRCFPRQPVPVRAARAA